MKKLIPILCLAAGLSLAAESPEARRPHPPTTRPPHPGKMAQAPAAPPPQMERPAEPAAPPAEHATTTTAGVAGYVVFVASALLFFRKTEGV